MRLLLLILKTISNGILIVMITHMIANIIRAKKITVTYFIGNILILIILHLMFLT